MNTVQYVKFVCRVYEKQPRPHGQFVRTALAFY